jgi:hypothetical protein
MRPSIRIHESKAKIGSTPSSAFVAYEKNKQQEAKSVTIKAKKSNCCLIL